MPVRAEVVRKKRLDIGESLGRLRQESVDEYREIPGRLRARAVLSEETAKRLDGLAGFRNVLVHEYADVDLRRVHAGLALDSTLPMSPGSDEGVDELGRAPAAHRGRGGSSMLRAEPVRSATHPERATGPETRVTQSQTARASHVRTSSKGFSQPSSSISMWACPAASRYSDP